MLPSTMKILRKLTPKTTIQKVDFSIEVVPKIAKKRVPAFGSTLFPLMRRGFVCKALVKFVQFFIVFENVC